MQYSAEITLRLPRESVLQLLTDRRNDVAWRPDLLMCEPIVGDAGWPGAETRLIYRRMGSGVRETMEHVVKSSLPDAIEYSLRSPNMSEHQVHRFDEVGSDETRWTIESTVDFQHARLALRRRAPRLETDARQSMESFREWAEGPSARTLLAAAESAASKRQEPHLRHFE